MLVGVSASSHQLCVECGLQAIASRTSQLRGRRAVSAPGALLLLHRSAGATVACIYFCLTGGGSAASLVEIDSVASRLAELLSSGLAVEYPEFLHI